MAGPTMRYCPTASPLHALAGATWSRKYPEDTEKKGNQRLHVFLGRRDETSVSTCSLKSARKYGGISPLLPGIPQLKTITICLTRPCLTGGLQGREKDKGPRVERVKKERKGEKGKKKAGESNMYHTTWAFHAQKVLERGDGEKSGKSRREKRGPSRKDHQPALETM